MVFQVLTDMYFSYTPSLPLFVGFAVFAVIKRRNVADIVLDILILLPIFRPRFQGDLRSARYLDIRRYNPQEFSVLKALAAGEGRSV